MTLGASAVPLLAQPLVVVVVVVVVGGLDMVALDTSGRPVSHGPVLLLPEVTDVSLVEDNRMSGEAVMGFPAAPLVVEAGRLSIAFSITPGVVEFSIGTSWKASFVMLS